MDIEKIAAAIAAGLVSGAAVAVRDWHKRRSARSVPAAAAQQVQQAKVLTDLADALGCSRALLMKAHNGGDIPDGGRDLKATIVAESDPPPGAPRVAQDYQARPITDREYKRLIHDVDKHGILLVRTEDLTEGTMLRDELELDGARSAWGAVVKRTPRRWYYVVIASRHVMDHEDAAARALIRTACSRLAALLALDRSIGLETK